MRNAYNDLVPITDQLAGAEYRFRIREKRVLRAAVKLGREGCDPSRLNQWSHRAIHALGLAVGELDSARRELAVVRARARRRGVP